MESLLPSIARNSFFSAFGKLSIKLIAFIFTIFIVRRLGDEDYGRYSLIWSYVVVYSMLADAGLGMLAIREIAKKRPGSPYIAANIIVIRVILTLASMALILGTVWALGYDRTFLLQVFLASQVLLLYAIHDPLDAVLQANERFDLSTLAIVVGLLVFVGAGFIFLWLSWHITGVILARLLNVLVSIRLAWRLLASYRADLQWQIKPWLWPGFLRTSLPFGLIKLWLSWSSRIDLIILAWFWPERMVGWYGAAYALIIGIMVIPNSINAVLYPAFSRQYAQNPAIMPRMYQSILKYLILISAPIAAGVYVTADKLVSLLYGAEFAPATTILPVIIWVVPLVSVSEFLRYVLLIANREQAAVRGLMFSVILNIALNLWLIPRYGFLAAAMAAVITEAVLVLLYVRQLRDELKSINLSGVLLKPLLATLILIVIVNHLSTVALFWQVSLGGLIYALTICILGVVQPAEVRLLFRSLKHTRSQLAAITMSKNLTATPLVSVFIQTYNAERFLGQAVDSVLGQTYPNYELIIINDGSTDCTGPLLEKYQTQPRVRVYHNKTNLGISPTWNIALSRCRGELIAKLDADDFYGPDQLETVVTFLQKHPEAGLIFSGSNLLYPDGRCESEMMFLRSGVHHRAAFLPTLLEQCIIRAPTVFVRSACYERLGGVVEQMTLHSDWEMWTRVAANYPVGFIARRLATYRLSYGSNSTAQAIVDGRSLADLKLWLNLLAGDKLPYRLNDKELNKLRWGMYDLVMHFAGIAAHHRQDELQQTYIAFAEQVLPGQRSTVQIEHTRRVYINLHQGIYAFQNGQPRKAGYHFLETLKIRPASISEVWVNLLLIFKVIKRVAAGFYQRALAKYCSA